MRHIKYILPLLLWVSCCNAQELEWVGQFGRPTSNDARDVINDIAVDDDGNVYVLGTSNSMSFDLDPTVGGLDVVEITDTDQYYASQVYLVKTDANGNYLWGKMFGTIHKEDKGAQLKIGSDGNIYALALIKYTDPASVNASLGNVTVFKIAPDGTTLNTLEIPSNVSMSGSAFIVPTALGVDSQNNIYIAGNYRGENPIPNSSGLKVGTGFNEGGFTLKLTNDGVCQWTTVFDAEEILFLQSNSLRLCVRPDGNINVTSQAGNDTQLFNFNAANGTAIWQKTFENQRIEAAGLTQSEIIISAHRYFIFPTVDVDPSPAVHSTNANAYFVILDLDGNFMSVKEYFTPNMFSLTLAAITADENNKLYISGHFKDTIDFDPSANTYIAWPPTSNLYNDEAYTMVFDENRDFENLIHFGQEVPDTSSKNLYLIRIIANIAKNGNLYLGGSFQGTCDFDPSTTQTYNLTTMNGTSTSNDDGFLLKLANCSLTPPAGPASQSFCAGSNAAVQNLVPASAAIKWYDSPTATTGLAATTTLVNGQTYYAARSGSTCPESQRLAVTVTLSPMPAAPVAGSAAFCESQSATLSDIAVTGTAIKWYATATDTAILPNTTALVNNTTYFASQTVNGCEGPRTAVTATITSAPVPAATSPQQFCIQQNIIVANIAATGQNLQWYDAATGGNLILATTVFSTNTTLYVTQTINGCESLRLPVVINIQDTPAPTGAASQQFCASQLPALSDITVTGSAVIWYDASTGGNVIIPATVLTDGITYYATQTLNGCESPGRLAVTVSLINTLNATGYQDLLCDEGNDVSEITNLTTYNPFLITNPENYSFTYFETQAGAQNNDAAYQINDSQQYTVQQADKIIYVRIMSQNGCWQVVALNLKLVNTPEVSIPDIVSFCSNDTLEISAGSGFNSYLWQDGSTATSLQIKKPGNYWVKVSYDYGTRECFFTKQFSVVQTNDPEILDIDILQDNSNGTIVVHSDTPMPVTFSLDNIHYQPENTFYNLEAGNYTVYAKNDCGIVSQKVSILYYPPYFTPNGDNKNDAWYIKYGAASYGLRVSIYDRFGKLLAQLSRNESWDGTYNGENLPATDYWFVAEKNGSILKKGHFSLIR